MVVLCGLFFNGFADEKILDEFLLLEKDGLSSDDVQQINSKILNK